MNSEYGLLVKFIDESPSFTYGFECGEIWSWLQNGNLDFTKTIHRVNISVIKEMCIKMGYVFDIKGYVDTEYAIIIAVKQTTSLN